MTKYAVIVAGGTGVRMGTTTPKQFLLLNNKPILWHSIYAFLQAFNDIHVIVVVPQQHVAYTQQIADSFENVTNKIEITIGGETRFQSVKNGLQLVQQNSVVFVHDAVRCLVTPQLIQQCYNQTLELGSAIPAVTATDSLRVVETNLHTVIDRSKVQIIQTPQTFLSSIILPAFEQPYNDFFTDEATVVENNGAAISLCNGDYNNIKITRPIDLIVAQEILKNRN